jgi:hypothetical protein
MMLYGLNLLFEEGLGDECNILIAGVIKSEVKLGPIFEHFLLLILYLKLLCSLVGNRH